MSTDTIEHTPKSKRTEGANEKIMLVLCVELHGE